MTIPPPFQLEFRVARWLVSGCPSEVEVALSNDSVEPVRGIVIELRSEAIQGGIAEHRIEGVLEPATFGRVERIALRPAAPGVYPNGALHLTVNSAGFYDLGGNVCEWCENWSDEKQEVRVLRGASWFTSDESIMLSSRRPAAAPNLRGSIMGFRCVLVVIED